MKFRYPVYKIVRYEEREIDVECPWCGSDDMEFEREDYELVKCCTCKNRTDLYEAIKQFTRRR